MRQVWPPGHLKIAFKFSYALPSFFPLYVDVQVRRNLHLVNLFCTGGARHDVAAGVARAERRPLPAQTSSHLSSAASPVNGHGARVCPVFPTPAMDVARRINMLGSGGGCKNSACDSTCVLSSCVGPARSPPCGLRNTIVFGSSYQLSSPSFIYRAPAPLPLDASEGGREAACSALRRRCFGKLAASRCFVSLSYFFVSDNALDT